MSRVLRFSGWTMIWAGGLIIAFLIYQLLGTNVLSNRIQAAAEDDLTERIEVVRAEISEEGVPPAVVLAPATEDSPAIEAVLYTEPIADEGDPFARFVIDKIELDVVLFEGVGRDTLKGGPGHMPWTSLPGQPGNAVISGHRTTYGAPFYRLDELEAGDEILIESEIGTSVFQVRELRIVLPTDVYVTENLFGGSWITLTTCNPRFSARERLIVFAELVDGPNFGYTEAMLETVLQEAS